MWYSVPSCPSRYFNPRSPRGERRDFPGLFYAKIHDFNPRSPRGERPISEMTMRPSIQISIHALREESDGGHYSSRLYRQISIHALREESDQQYPRESYQQYNFNPRSPRGERLYSSYLTSPSFYFNPRSPRGERQDNKITTRGLANFNPRSPRGERQHIISVNPEPYMNFNPRSPRGERQGGKVAFLSVRNISIHALREESDRRTACKFWLLLSISIHALREESDTP